MDKPNLLDQHGRPVEESRDTSVFSLRDPRLIDLLGANRSHSGEPVTVPRAARVPTYWACARDISTDVGCTPRIVYAPGAGGRGFTALRQHKVTQLLRVPNRETNGPSLFESWMLHALTMQLGMMEIVRNGLGEPVALYLLDPLTSTLLRREQDQQIFVAVRTDREGFVTIPADDVLMLHGPGYDSLRGVPTTYTGREVLGGLLSLSQVRGALFKNGLMPSGSLEHPGALGDEAFKRLQDDMRARYQGAVNAYEPLILEEGMKYSVLSFDPEKAQLLDFQKASDLDVCRLFRMPPTKVGILENAHLRNVEELDVQYRTDTLLPWETRIEHELDRKLFTLSERNAGHHVRHEVNWILRARLDDQAKYLHQRFVMGSITPNEVRAIYGDSPMEHGDKLFLQGAMMTIDGIVSRSATAEEPREPEFQNIDRAFESILSDSLRRSISLELSKLSRASSVTMRAEIAEKHKEHLRDCIAPVVRSYLESINKEVDLQKVLCDYIDSHAREIATVESYTAWRDDARIQQDARAILQAARENAQ